MIMNIEQFQEEMKQRLAQRLGSGYQINCVKNNKGNQVELYGLDIRKAGENMNPVIYLIGHFKDYIMGTELEDIVSQIEDVIYENTIPELDMDFLLDYDKAKEYMCCKLINTGANQELLKSVPHIPYLDLSIVFYMYLPQTGDMQGTIVVRNNLLEEWNVDADQVYRDAMDNMCSQMVPQIQNIGQVLMELLGPADAGLFHDLLDEMKDQLNLDMMTMTNQRGLCQ